MKHAMGRLPIAAVIGLAVLLLSSSLANCGGPGSTAPGDHVGKLQLKTPLATPTPSAATLAEFALPSANSYLGGLTKGPDGNMWLTECDANKIARVTLAGTITEFPVPTASTCPQFITPASDGALWFNEANLNTIGRITTAGVITEFPLPPPLATAPQNLNGIAAGPDGNIWFVHAGANVVGVMSMSGNLIATYAIPTANSNAGLIISGPDGNMWFGDQNNNKIARITLSGTITEFTIPSPPLTPPTSGAGAIGGIVAGLDGNIWFTERLANQVARITPAGVITEFGPFATGDLRFQRIATTPDGYFWFAEYTATAPFSGEIAKMNPFGTLVAEYALPGGRPRGVAVGPDNNVWFADEFQNVVGNLTTGLRR